MKPVIDEDKTMILYKYLTVEKADEWLIGEDSILLTPPIYLNDLLEFRVRREPADLEERRSLYQQFQQEGPSQLPFEEFDRSITAKAHVDSEPHAMREMLSEAFGVVSLTSDPMNKLMWAHYGLNSGVAVGYQSEALEERSGMKFSFLPIGMAMEVNYTNHTNPLKKDFSDAARLLTTKQECWAYELEWRIIQDLPEAKPVRRDGKTFYALPAKREQIAHVVFGANAEAAFIERVRGWLRDRPARFQKVFISHDSQELELSDI
jgi:hypothetical protein